MADHCQLKTNHKVYDEMIPLSTYLPQPCYLCGKLTAPDPICRACSIEFKPICFPCPQCSLPLTSPGVCGECWREPPAFHHTCCVWRYEWPLSEVLKGYKYKACFELLPYLAQQLRTTIEDRSSSLPTALVPVPLSRSRLRSRGFNQSLELARALSAQLPHHPEIIHVGRHPQDTPLTLMTRSQRTKSLKHAFYLLSKLEHKHIAIVDDVVTTTSTTRCLAKLLAQEAPQRIEVWALARTPKF